MHGTRPFGNPRKFRPVRISESVVQRFMGEVVISLRSDAAGAKNMMYAIERAVTLTLFRYRRHREAGDV